MHSFRENVVLVNNDGGDSFPDHFENEIYYARDFRPSKFRPDEVVYTSNVSLKYVFTGHESYLVNGERKELRDHQLLLVNNHSEVILEEAEGNCLSIFLNPSLIEQCHHGLTHSCEDIDEVGKTTATDLFDEPHPSSNAAFSQIKKRIDNNPDIIVTQDFYYELASIVVSSQLNVSRKIDLINSIKYSTRIEIFRRLNRAIVALNDSLDEPFNLDLLSREAALSKFHLIRHFKSVYGETPHRYFVKKKLKKAHQLLINQLPVKDVAHQLGYPDSSSFGKQYRQLFGVSPSQAYSI